MRTDSNVVLFSSQCKILEIKSLNVKSGFHFGCCLQNRKVCRDYFINEIEYLPNLFPEYNTHVDVLQKTGKSIISKINSLKKT